MSGPSSRGIRAAALPCLVLLLASAAPARALDLEQVLAEVDAANPTLTAERSMARAAAARQKRAGAWDAPMLDLMIENVPVSGYTNVDPMTMRVVGLEQRIELFGARGLAKRALGRDVRAVEASAEDMRWMRFAEAWTAYAGAWFAGQRARAAAEHRAVMDRMSASARARYESGRGRLDDLMRAEAERARVVGDAAMFAAEESAARARLDALRGREPGGAADSLSPPPEFLAADTDIPWSDVVAAHPRVRAAGEREAARRGQAAAMRRMNWPELTLRASYGFREDLVDPAGGHGTIESDDMWSAGVGIMLPIGNGSRQGAEAQEMTSMADAAAAERRGTSLALQSDIAALRARIAASRRVTTLLADTVLAAQRRALAAAWSGYEAGSGDLSNVLASAHASYAEELDLTRVREGLAASLAELLAVTARPDLFALRLPHWSPTGRKP